MVQFPDKISRKVFRRRIDSSVGTVSLTQTMFGVLGELDGEKDNAEVATALNLDMEGLGEALKRLYDLKLIEEVKDPGPVVDRNFFLYLRDQYADYMGPMAGRLIKDEIAGMNKTPSSFPKKRAPELVERLAGKLEKENRKDFIQSMRKFF